MRLTLALLAALATTGLCADPITDQGVVDNVNLLITKVQGAIQLAKQVTVVCENDPPLQTFVVPLLGYAIAYNEINPEPVTTEDKWAPVVAALNDLVASSMPLSDGLGSRTTPFDDTILNTQIYGRVKTLYDDLWTLFTARLIVQSDTAAVSQGAVLRPAMFAVYEQSATIGVRVVGLTNGVSTASEFNKLMDQAFKVMDLAVKLYTVPS